MDNKYSINTNKNGKITWVRIENQNGEAETRKIENVNNDTEYMKQLDSIDSKYNDFFNKFFDGEVELKKESYFKRQKLKETGQANKKIRNRMAAIGTAAVLALTSVAYGIGSLTKANKESYAKTTTTEQNLDNQYQINEKNQKLQKIYKKLLKYEKGEQIVEQLKFIDKKHEQINSIAIKNPDEKGKVSYITAEELAAISDVYNAQNNQATLLESDDLIRCNYFTGQAALINLSQGSRDVQEIDDIFKDETLMEQQQEIQKSTQKTLDNLNIATPGFVKMLDDIYSTRGKNPELQSEVAFGQAGLAAALTDEMSGKTLENYQIASKTEGGQLSELITKASSDSKRAAIEDNQINLEEQQLINDALKTIDNKRIADLDRTDYNPSTTEKGKDMVVAIIGNLGITSGGDYVVRNTTSHTSKKISKKEAEKIFGKEKVKELENKAKVDTDGDGKNDTPLDEANKESKEEGTKEAKDRAAGYQAGQVAFTNGGPSTTNQGSKAYRAGYSAGYQHAKEVYESQSKDDSKKEENEFVEEKPTESTKPTEPTTPKQEEPPVIDEWVPETTTQETQPATTQQTTKEKTMTIERDGVVYETQIETTSKVKNYNAYV
ncbi:MAG: hypothetical protein ACI31R_03695 [Bacilli bacterium]